MESSTPWRITSRTVASAFERRGRWSVAARPDPGAATQAQGLSLPIPRRYDHAIRASLPARREWGTTDPGVPVWQLSIGPWRVFYDVTGTTVIVRALRFKGPHKTTREIL